MSIKHPKPDIISTTINNRYNYIVATRAPRIKNICNLRDLGGYENEQKKVVKWGFLFRSGCIHNVDSTGTKKLNSLGIRTLIDFNDHSRFSIPDSGLKIGQIKHLPINLITTSHIYERLKNETLRRAMPIFFCKTYSLRLSIRANLFTGRCSTYCSTKTTIRSYSATSSGKTM